MVLRETDIPLKMEGKENTMKKALIKKNKTPLSPKNITTQNNYMFQQISNMSYLLKII